MNRTLAIPVLAALLLLGSAGALEVALVPPVGDDALAGRLRSAAAEVGVTVDELQPTQLVDPQRLSPAVYPLVVLVGGERFPDTVVAEGDASAALRRYVEAGGTLLIAADELVFSRPQQWNGESWRSITAPLRQVELQTALGLLAAGQTVDREPPGGSQFVTQGPPALGAFLPGRFPADTAGYRPIPSDQAPGVTFTPLVTLVDAEGGTYGAAVAETKPADASGSVIYAWAPLLAGEQGALLLKGLLAHRAEQALPAEQQQRRGDALETIGALEQRVLQARAMVPDALAGEGLDEIRGRLDEHAATLAWLRDAAAVGNVDFVAVRLRELSGDVDSLAPSIGRAVDAAVAAAMAQPAGVAVAETPAQPGTSVVTPTEVTPPTTPAEQPTAPVEQPTAPAETPVTPVETPTTPAEQPTAPVEQPTAPVETPAPRVDTPPAAPEEPANPAEQPATAETTVSEPSGAREPGAEPRPAQPTPPAPAETPVAPAETPVAPAETPTTPVETPTAPVETPTAPVETPTAPVETPTAPVEQPTAPAETPTAARFPDVENPVVAFEIRDQGTIYIELLPKLAPKTASSILYLVREGFYEGTYFHRRIEDFLVQGGDPYTKELPPDDEAVGRGGPEWQVPGEFTNELSHTRGTVSLARAPSDPDSGGSQFFILLDDHPSLDEGGWAIFGRVIEGMDVVDNLQVGDRVADTRVVQGAEPTNPEGVGPLDLFMPARGRQ